ncbi:CPBP family intramembrane glutamic endopeptidase [Pseudonocardia sp. KRD291]|uniref:CPBP family intramembrane glutamic endopeptidase n=1 Tax=Pseudonocardia sp. KRD291 TaxID=2792007 RepID=UPI001C5C447A|nr:type II CAAX endopeptidase family protein [Pseudonocardia sp. KRD291]MBW0106819.1 CPBP family intramembrane metalloprotease [Pseudonocardia sp. KRD291]
MTTAQNWLLDDGAPRNAPAVPAGVEYHRVLAGEKRRIGRGILAIVLLAAGFVLLPTVIGGALALVDVRLGNTPPTLGGTDYTPLHHAGSMISLGLLAPWSMLIQRWLYGVPGASLHSVTSRFRFGLFGRSLLVLGPVWLVVVLLGFAASVEESPWSHADLIAMLLVTLLLTPLQAAGEEYGVRGLVFRVIGSWTRGRLAGLVLGIVVSSVLFTLVHGSTDPYVVVWYLVLFGGLAVITWRTGGLEIAIMLHAVLNTLSLAAAPYLRIDLGAALQDRSETVGAAYQLVPALTVVVLTAVIWWATRRSGPARTAAPTGAHAGADHLVA